VFRESWKTVWERKGTAAAGRDGYSEEELFAVDGFDTATGKTSIATRSRIGAVVCGKLGIVPGQTILEVGCGAGAVLSLLRETGASLAGVDYSAPHIEIARRALPEAELRASEASALPFADGQFDGVFSHGVFLYFPDFVYAGCVLREMARVATLRARLLIMDVPDAETERECKEARTEAGASLTPAHLYYPKQFFEQFALDEGFHVETFPQDVPDYRNAAFRYNVLLERAGGRG
jgi:ubiquinone/menaquinone biosynthesis C-methylase UbiE